MHQPAARRGELQIDADIAAKVATLNQALDAMVLGARRIDFVGFKFQSADECAALYSQAQVLAAVARMLEEEFAIKTFSLYEIVPNKNQMTPLFVDGEQDVSCRWCDPQILVRSEGCRARRTGHRVDGIANPGICYAFQPPDGDSGRKHYCLPIIQSGLVGNVLQLVTTAEDEDRLASQIPFVNVYLREAAPVLETKRLMETLRESSLSDPMMMLDLDHFKMVNDTYGHDAGDTVLKALAKVLRQSVRTSDLVIRFGGEEFLIILVDTPSSDADMVAEKIRAAVEALTVQAGTVVLRKTISIGLSDFPTDSDTFWQAVKFADVALYQAKEGGRNRVVRFTESMWENKKEY